MRWSVSKKKSALEFFWYTNDNLSRVIEGRMANQYKDFESVSYLVNGRDFSYWGRFKYILELKSKYILSIHNSICD